MAYVQEFDGDINVKGKVKGASFEGVADITVDEVPTENSENPVSSGGTFTGLAGKVSLGTDVANGGDTKNAVTSFTEASTRENIVTGEKHKTIFGKIKKWFTDLKAVAFSGSYNDLMDKPALGPYKLLCKLEVPSAPSIASLSSLLSAAGVSLPNGNYLFTAHGPSLGRLNFFHHAGTSGTHKKVFVNLSDNAVGAESYSDAVHTYPGDGGFNVGVYGNTEYRMHRPIFEILGGKLYFHLSSEFNDIDNVDVNWGLDGGSGSTLHLAIYSWVE